MASTFSHEMDKSQKQNKICGDKKAKAKTKWAKRQARLKKVKDEDDEMKALDETIADVSVVKVLEWFSIRPVKKLPIVRCLLPAKIAPAFIFFALHEVSDFSQPFAVHRLHCFHYSLNHQQSEHFRTYQYPTVLKEVSLVLQHVFDKMLTCCFANDEVYV